MSYTMTVQTEASEHEIEFEASVSRYIPARTNCSNDDACPAEGGEIEVEEAWLIRGKRKRKLDAAEVHDRFSEEIAEAIERAD